MARVFAAFIFVLWSAPSYALDLTGSITQGGFIKGQADAPDAEVYLDGKRLTTTPDGIFIFGFGRDHDAETVLEIRYPDGRTERKVLDILPREYDIQRIDGLQKKMVSPPEEVWNRIAKDRTLVANARAHETAQAYFSKGFVRPATGPVSGVYGSQRILNGVPKQPHFGIDYAAPAGAPVLAPADGVVRLAHPDMYYTGGTVIIDHGYGLNSTLMHMSALDVTEGQLVSQGERIGAVGATGRATGPHLDWRMNWYDRRIDPALVLEHFAAGKQGD